MLTLDARVVVADADPIEPALDAVVEVDPTVMPLARTRSLAGADGICVLANYSEQFLLTDDERSTLTDLCLTHIAGRVPVIVTCSHFSTRIAADRARGAAAAGAGHADADAA